MDLVRSFGKMFVPGIREDPLASEEATAANGNHTNGDQAKEESKSVCKLTVDAAPKS